MARTADHQARQSQIIAGVRALVAAEGMSSVTIARAARSAGVSVGLVQHYYDSKAELLSETFLAVRAGIEQRVDTATVRAERRHARIQEMLLAGLEQLLPLDARRREETYIAAAFAGLALEDESLSTTVVTADEGLTRRAAQALVNGKACGEVPVETDTEGHAYALIALASGLAGRLLASDGRRERALARQALAAEVAALCPGECTN